MFTGTAQIIRGRSLTPSALEIFYIVKCTSYILGLAAAEVRGDLQVVEGRFHAGVFLDGPKSTGSSGPDCQAGWYLGCTRGAGPRCSLHMPRRSTPKKTADH